MSVGCTSRQALGFVRRYCDFLSPEEQDLILSGNAARIFGVETTR